MKIIALGDSLMQRNDFTSYPQVGWVQMLRLFLEDENYCILNYAKNGRSTKSFIDEGRFQEALSQVEEGDLVYLSFCHNDQKKEDPSRYTTPDGTYLLNLKTMIAKLKEKGATIIYVGPIDRITKDGHCRDDSFEGYDIAAKRLMEELEIFYIDPKELRPYYKAIKPDKTKKLHLIYEELEEPPKFEPCSDTTHLSTRGGYLVANLIAYHSKKYLQQEGRDIFLPEIPSIAELIEKINEVKESL